MKTSKERVPSWYKRVREAVFPCYQVATTADILQVLLDIIQMELDTWADDKEIGAKWKRELQIVERAIHDLKELK